MFPFLLLSFLVSYIRTVKLLTVNHRLVEEKEEEEDEEESKQEEEEEEVQGYIHVSSCQCFTFDRYIFTAWGIYVDTAKCNTVVLEFAKRDDDEDEDDSGGGGSGCRRGGGGWCL
ncbi:hypothetical protein M0802_002463 [Mischocyttarus mexicanus]|nr:hypothetical protein M0802_002463 [Mischocyttarus mexicanus]